MKPIMVERARAQQGARTDIRQISDESKPIRTDEAVTRARACEDRLVRFLTTRFMSCRARACEVRPDNLLSSLVMSCRVRACEVRGPELRKFAQMSCRARACEGDYTINCGISTMSCER